MRRIIRLLAIVAAISSAIWLVSARKRAKERAESIGQVLRRDSRSLVTHRFDPLVLRFGLAGGRRSVWGVVEHAGRTTGTIYHTPVFPLLAGDHLYIPLPYGADADWVRNVRTAGHCRLQAHETIYELDEPSVVGVEQNEILPDALRRTLGRIGSLYLRLHVLDRAPGTFAHAPAEAAVATLPIHEVHLEMVGQDPGGDSVPGVR